MKERGRRIDESSVRAAISGVRIRVLVSEGGHVLTVHEGEHLLVYAADDAGAPVNEAGEDLDGGCAGLNCG